MASLKDGRGTVSGDVEVALATKKKKHGREGNAEKKEALENDEETGKGSSSSDPRKKRGTKKKLKKEQVVKKENRGRKRKTVSDEKHCAKEKKKVKKEKKDQREEKGKEGEENAGKMKLDCMHKVTSLDLLLFQVIVMHVINKVPSKMLLL
jgi:hypothetical protein